MLSMNRQQAINQLRPVLERRYRAHGGSDKHLNDIAATNDVGGDVGDESSRAEEQAVGISLMESSVETKQLIADALDRMNNGTFGVCTACDKPIPLARLQALPYAPECIDCKRELEKRSGGVRHRLKWTLEEKGGEEQEEEGKENEEQEEEGKEDEEQEEEQTSENGKKSHSPAQRKKTISGKPEKKPAKRKKK